MYEKENIYEEENIIEKENLYENDNEVVFSVIQKNFTIDLNTNTSELIIDQNNIKLIKNTFAYPKNYYLNVEITNTKGTFYYSSSS